MAAARTHDEHCEGCKTCRALVLCRGCKETWEKRDVNYEGYCDDCERAQQRGACRAEHEAVR